MSTTPPNTLLTTVFEASFESVACRLSTDCKTTWTVIEHRNSKAIRESWSRWETTCVFIVIVRFYKSTPQRKIASKVVLISKGCEDKMDNTTEEKSIELQEGREKCFVIMPFSDQGDYSKGHFQKVFEQIFQPAIEEAGYEAYRVDQDKISSPIINKIFEAIQDCPMALCDLSNRNPNVLYELGLRQAYDKPVVLVQDEKTPRIFDVSGINTIQYSSDRLYENVIEARKKITEALISTRDGKTNSIVKIVQVESASMTTGTISQQDRIEVMLKGIMNDINEIRNLEDRTSYVKNYETNVYPEDLFYENINANNLKKSRIFWNSKSGKIFLVKLKKDITIDEINDALNKIKNKGIKIRYTQNGNQLAVEVLDDYLKINIVMVQEILEDLGEIKEL